MSVRPMISSKSQRVRHFFVAPLISADHRDAQHLHLRRLNHQHQRLHIAAAGAGAVFVDDDFAARLGQAESGGQQQP